MLPPRSTLAPRVDGWDPREVYSTLTFFSEVISPEGSAIDCSGPSRDSLVLRISQSGDDWIVKRSRLGKHFSQEETSYRTWVPALNGLAPRIVAASAENKTMILTYEPGQVGVTHTPEMFYHAGQLLRRFHSAAPPRPDEGVTGRLSRKLAKASETPRFLASKDLQLARECVSATVGLADVGQVPTHGNNEPSNWLVDSTGAVRMIGFSRSRYDVWVRDFVHVSLLWRHRSDLREAYLDGYGTWMEESDLRLLIAYRAVCAVGMIQWGEARGNLRMAECGRDHLSLLREELG